MIIPSFKSSSDIKTFLKRTENQREQVTQEIEGNVPNNPVPRLNFIWIKLLIAFFVTSILLVLRLYIVHSIVITLVPFVLQSAWEILNFLMKRIHLFCYFDTFILIFYYFVPYLLSNFTYSVIIDNNYLIIIIFFFCSNFWQTYKKEITELWKKNSLKEKIPLSYSHNSHVENVAQVTQNVARCFHCVREDDNLFHKIFVCKFWNEKRTSNLKFSFENWKTI